MKFPQGEGSAVIHRKKNRPALQRRDILTVSLVVCLFVCFLNIFYRNFLRSSSTQFWVVLFFISFYTAPFSWKHFFSGVFVRCFSTQLFFLVVLLLLLLNMTAFSYVGLLSFFWVWLFHAVFLSHLPPISFLDGLSSEQFAELESVHLLALSARACSLAFLSLAVPFLAICRAVLIYVVLFSALFSGSSLFSDSVDFSTFYLIFSWLFRGSSSTALFFFLVLFFLVLSI